jgi:non-ribosomal peptide synthetase component F
MAAEIAVAEGAENGIDQSVQDGIGIRVANQAPIVCDLDAAQNQLSPALKAVHIKPMSNAKFRCHDFEAAAWPHHHLNPANIQQLDRQCLDERLSAGVEPRRRL